MRISDSLFRIGCVWSYMLLYLYWYEYMAGWHVHFCISVQCTSKIYLINACVRMCEYVLVCVRACACMCVRLYFLFMLIINIVFFFCCELNLPVFQGLFTEIDKEIKYKVIQKKNKSSKIFVSFTFDNTLLLFPKNLKKYGLHGTFVFCVCCWTLLCVFFHE